ncbi:hypothetical protein HYALB_00001113 [Hymenoscyphus albidus]|uniref:protein-tyrosine-phosphatase n=1 Tax=Hymenoscyphus albidus TaxID=595503 RepID=A0A9N9LBY9_9HELO|nr:hypothetical protein HYALB_00001113 [Hymenoscyphus albidus]
MALSRVPGDDEIYVSGVFALRRKSALERCGITHILSILVYDFKDYQDLDKYKHLQIDALDVEDENLLGEFEKTGKWIEEALTNGGKDGAPGRVLIHCAMGKSRSVTVTIAFLLRKYPQLSVDSALEMIRQERPLAEPNDGFMAQLELYKEMGCPRDIDEHPKYQRWLYRRTVDEALAAGSAPEMIRFEDEVKQENTEGSEKELRCKRCRRTLATTTYLIPHAPASTTPSGSTKNSASTTCTHHFLHPLSWMRPTLSPEIEEDGGPGPLTGRLECPNLKCLAQVGRFAWQGMRCSCGVWVCPAFSLQKGRVDEVIYKGKVEDVGIGPQASTAMARGASDDANVVAKMRGLSIRLPPGMKTAQGSKPSENL